MTYTWNVLCLTLLNQTTCQIIPEDLLLLDAHHWRWWRSHIVLSGQCLRCLTRTFWFRIQYLQIRWWHLTTCCQTLSFSPTSSYLPCQKFLYHTYALYKTVACLSHWWMSLHLTGWLDHHLSSFQIMRFVLLGSTSRSKRLSLSSWC